MPDYSNTALVTTLGFFGLGTAALPPAPDPVRQARSGQYSASRMEVYDDAENWAVATETSRLASYNAINELLDRSFSSGSVPVELVRPVFTFWTGLLGGHGLTLNPPLVARSVNGTIEFSWNTPSYYFSVEFLPDGVEYFLVDRSASQAPVEGHLPLAVGHSEELGQLLGKVVYAPSL